jgi:hypothetical protein
MNDQTRRVVGHLTNMVLPLNRFGPTVSDHADETYIVTS